MKVNILYYHENRELHVRVESLCHQWVRFLSETLDFFLAVQLVYGNIDARLCLKKWSDVTQGSSCVADKSYYRCDNFENFTLADCHL
jgi:hypothetical protein